MDRLGGDLRFGNAWLGDDPQPAVIDLWDGFWTFGHAMSGPPGTGGAMTAVATGSRSILNLQPLALLDGSGMGLHPTLRGGHVRASDGLR